MIPPEHYYVQGHSVDSFDSRYRASGLVRAEQVLGTVVPLFLKQQSYEAHQRPPFGPGRGVQCHAGMGGRSTAPAAAMPSVAEDIPMADY